MEPSPGMPECHLRVLSGPHLGNCVPLPEGSYSLGNGETADFLFLDPAMREEHVVLEVGRGNVRMSILHKGERTYLDGRLLDGEPAALSPRQVFTLGKTHFTLLERGGDEWDSIPLPELEPLDRAEFAEEEVSEGEAEPGSGEEEAAGDGGMEDGGNRDEARDEESPRRSRAFGWLLGGLAMIALVTAVVMFLSPSEEDSGGGETRPREEVVREALGAFPAESGLRVVHDEARNVVSVEGLVSSVEARTEVTSAVRRIDPRARLKLSAVSQVEASVKALVDRAGGDGVIAGLSLDGTLALSGLVPTEEAKERLLDSLLGDLPQLQTIDAEKLWSQEALGKLLTDLTVEAGLAEEITYRLDQGDVVAQGRILRDRSTRYRRLRKNLGERLAPVFNLRDEVRFFIVDPVKGMVETEIEPETEPTPQTAPPEKTATDTSTTSAPPKTAEDKPSEVAQPSSTAPATVPTPATSASTAGRVAPAAGDSVAVGVVAPTTTRPAFRLSSKADRAPTTTAPAKLIPGADEEMVRKEIESIENFKNLTIGSISWVVTSDRQKLLRGAQLPSGFVVESITREAITLVRGNEVKTINFK
ncbi:MAG: hypothetical protein JNJ70_09950 [Verrucomicrobiales bacterium]|nr:hypothetical protein [Verrucomicrobiales bacterium]